MDRGNRAWVLVLVVMAVLAGACSGGDDGDASEVSAGRTEEGAVKDDGKRRELNAGTNGPATAGEVVATSAEDWREKWVATGATVPAPDVNDVDFGSEVVVGLFAGERSTGGWKIDPDVTVKVQGRFAAVAYEIVGPGEGCQSTQAITAPYLVLAVKGEAVRFERSERTEPCE